VKNKSKKFEKPKWIRLDNTNSMSDLYLINYQKIKTKTVIDAYDIFLKGCVKKPFRKEAKDEFERFLAELKNRNTKTIPILPFYSIKILSSKTFCKGANHISEGLILWDSLFCVRPKKQFYTQWTRGDENSPFYGDGWKAEPQSFMAEINNWWEKQQHCQGNIPKKILVRSAEFPAQDVQSLPLVELGKRARQSKGKPSSTYIRTKQYQRNLYIVEYIKRKVKGKCQLCKNNTPFKAKDGTPYLECHHIHWLSEDGEDSLENTVALCPNCHRKMHVINSMRDKIKLKIKAKALAKI
jgi:hypothetical protein